MMRWRVMPSQRMATIEDQTPILNQLESSANVPVN
jgi:hypothetical protein